MKKHVLGQEILSYELAYALTAFFYSKPHVKEMNKGTKICLSSVL